MKKEAHTNPKMYDLAARLNTSRPAAIGYLNLLLDFAADHAPAGDVGKWPNAAIARACDWLGDPDEFVNALVAAGWLDTPEAHRLAIHDISKHAPSWWKIKNGRNNVRFWDDPEPQPKQRQAARPAEHSAEPTAEHSAEATADRTVERSSYQTKPNQDKPNQTGPDRTGPDHAHAHARPSTDPPEPPDRPPAPYRPPEPSDSPADPFRDWPELDHLAGQSYPTQRAARCASGIFAPLADKHLRDPCALFEWLTRQATSPTPLLPCTPQALVLTLAMAAYVQSRPQHSIRTSRIALFASLMGSKTWHACRHLVPDALDLFKLNRDRFDQASKFIESQRGIERRNTCAIPA